MLILYRVACGIVLIVACALICCSETLEICLPVRNAVTVTVVVFIIGVAIFREKRAHVVSLVTIAGVGELVQLRYDVAELGHFLSVCLRTRGRRI